MNIGLFLTQVHFSFCYVFPFQTWLQSFVDTTKPIKRKATSASDEGTEHDTRAGPEQEGGDAADDVHLTRSCVHDKLVQTSKTVEVTSKTGKKRKIIKGQQGKLMVNKKMFVLDKYNSGVPLNTSNNEHFKVLLAPLILT